MKRCFVAISVLLSVMVMVHAASAQTPGPTPGPTIDQTLVLDVNASGPGPEALAAHVPAAQRATTVRQLAQILDAYHQIEQKLGLASNEPAGAVASFVAGSLAAAQHVDIADPAFAAFVGQVRSAFAAHPDVVAALHLDRRAVVEQIEILGLMMLVAERNKGDASTRGAMSAAARRYVQQYLSFDIADVELTSTGLRWARGAPAGPLAVIAGGSPARGHEAAAASPPPSVPVGTADIETVGFDTRTQVGVGGQFIFVPAPVVLFKSGEALLDIAGLGDPDGLAHHKQARPKDWTTWRRNGEVIEKLRDGKWVKLPYSKTMGPLPAKFTLDGSYSHLGGGGNVAYGGNVSIAAWSDLRFDRSGKFSTGGGSSYSSSSAVASSQAATSTGSYSISGYTLTLRYADGHSETRSIVAEAKDPSTIWLNGIGFTSK